MAESLNESRFFMWRAVFAMAHADHVVVEEEKEFMVNYLEQVPFSEEQKEVLRGDIEAAQSVHEMFDYITVPEDRGEFFQFARMLCWCDGDFDAQEEAIKGKLQDLQMKSLDKEHLEKELSLSREMGAWQREKDEAEFSATASNVIGLGAFTRGLVKGLQDIVRK